jgi:3-deoxy-7-phosphoheptulonate synthase
MIITLEPDAPQPVVDAVMTVAFRFQGVTPRIHVFGGARHTVTEVHLIGPSKVMQAIPDELFREMPGVRAVVRVSQRYRLVGRHGVNHETPGFTYNGVTFNDDSMHVFAGLCAVDAPEHVEAMMAALQENGVVTTRMGAYKPRTSPYDFQGLGAECLPWVFESAGKHDIKVIAMEVTHARHIQEIWKALEESGRATGVMLQVGTRNAQNFELLKEIGAQRDFPVLFKRGMGISLEESLNACEYVATEGNPNILFCLRGVKTHLGDPHRNLVDFSHVPVVRRLTRLPVCVDPSHSVGRLDATPDGLPDIIHVVGQGVIAGATAVLIDFHPRPELALCDGGQALRLEQLPRLLRYVRKVRETYLELTRGDPAAATERISA